MSLAIVVEFAYAVQGRIRDDCVALADEVGSSIIDKIGGEPWVMLDDDWSRCHVQQLGHSLTLADDQGFYYQGMRKYKFGGPFVGSVDTSLRDGFRTQRSAGDES